MIQSKGDIMRRFADLERQIRELRAERRLASSTIAAGGTLRVVDTHGTVVAVIGNLDEVIPGKHGFWLGRPGLTPSQAVSVFGTGEGGDLGFVGLWDRAGNYIVTDDAESGQGLARPYLSLPIGELSAPTATTTSGTFVDVAAGATALHHPVLYAYMLVRSDNGTTTGEVRLTLNGNVIGSTISIAGNEFAIRTIGPFDVSPLPVFTQINTIAAQARRTAGAGNIGLRVLSILGLESAYTP